MHNRARFNVENQNVFTLGMCRLAMVPHRRTVDDQYRTTDVAATVNQIKALERVGADIVRVSVPTMDAAEAFRLIKQVNVPLVADIHFDYRIALKVASVWTVCVSTRATSVTKNVSVWWLIAPAIKHSYPYRRQRRFACRKVRRTNAAGAAGISYAPCRSSRSSQF